MANCITTVCILIFLPLFLYAHEYDPSPGYAPTIKFEHLSVDQGLSYNSVLDIIQDDQGFMWFATEDGLNKYDGYKVTVYKNIKNVSSSLSNNFVYDIHKDHSGILWIATAFGLNKYDRAHDNFVRYFDTLPDAGDVGSNSICDISNPDPLNDEILWLGTDYGLCEVHTTTGQYKRNFSSEEIGQKPSLFEIRDIIADPFGFFWIASINGLFKWDRQQEVVTPYFYDVKNPENVSRGKINELCLDQSGHLWYGTFQDEEGLIRIVLQQQGNY